MANANLTAAKTAKNDEFYTRLEDIEKECHHYKEHFRDKVIYCNCDDPRKSNFFSYFVLNFEHFGLKRLISTGYNANGHGVACVYEGGGNNNIEIVDLKGSGDFRSDECVEFLKESDIVISNPPFSYFRVYVALLMMYNKKFLIIGNMNAITYKEIFPLIKENKLWWGISISSGDRAFYVPDDYELNAAGCGYENGRKYIKVKGVRWFTNLPHDKRNHPLDLCRWYEKELQNYPKYSNYNAIEVSKTCNIPADYQGVMGVPITFFDKYCPKQFEIVGLTSSSRENTYGELIGNGTTRAMINDKPIYARILIRNLHPISYNDYFNGNF